MPGARVVAASLVFLAVAAGCNPFTTRQPVCGPLPPVTIEGPSQERFDPFADEDLGPDTFTRPPDYLRGRDNARTLLQNSPRPVPITGQGPLNPFPGLGGPYPNSVR